MEILYIVALALVSSGVLGLLYLKLKSFGAKKVAESSNNIDDMIFAAAENLLDDLVEKGEVQLEEMLKKKLDAIEAKKKAESGEEK